MNILALEVGTEAVKAVVLDTVTGRPVGPLARQTYALDHREPDAAEIQAQRLWQLVAGASRAAIQAGGVSGRPGQDVQAVGLACFLSGLVLLGANDRPLLPIRTSQDRRARPVARQVWRAVGEEFLHESGNRPLPGRTTVLCYRQMLAGDPYLLHEVRSYLHVQGWLAFHMTGEKAFDPANACCTGLFGTVTDQRWSQRWCDYFEVDRGWLPQVISADSTVGHVRPGIAAALGVPAGVPVKLGTDLAGSAILAAGMEAEDLYHVVDATQALSLVTDKPAPSPRRWTRLLGAGHRFVQQTHNPVGIVALDWLHQLCFREQTREEFFATTVPQALKHSTRVTLDPAYLADDGMEIEAHRAAFRDLQLSTDRLDLLAALLQAMVRHHREAVVALGQEAAFHRVFLSGAGADLLGRLLPEYHTAEVHPIEDGALFGIAKLFTVDKS